MEDKKKKKKVTKPKVVKKTIRKDTKKKSVQKSQSISPELQNKIINDIKEQFKKALGLRDDQIQISAAVFNSAEDANEKLRNMTMKSRFHKDQFLQDVMANYERVSNIIIHGPSDDHDVEIIHKILRYFLSHISEMMMDSISFNEEFGSRLKFLSKK